MKKGPALDRAGKGWTRKIVARGRERVLICGGKPFCLSLAGYQISCVLQPAKSPTCAPPTNGKPSTEEIREIWR